MRLYLSWVRSEARTKSKNPKVAGCLRFGFVQNRGCFDFVRASLRTHDNERRNWGRRECVTLRKDKKMKIIQHKKRGLWPAMLAVALLVGGTLPARAANDWDDLTEVRKQIGDETFRNQPAQAIEQLQTFYTSRKLEPNVAAEVVLQVAQITDVQLKKPDEALKMLDAAMDGVRAAHDPKRPVEVMYLDGKVAFLVRQSKIDEAIALLKANRPMIVDGARSDDTHLQMFASRTLNDWANALDANKATPQETISLLENTMNDMPVFLDPQNQRALDWHQGWMYERLVAKLVEAKQFDRALQWGKLFWAETPYDKEAIGRATASLNSIWLAQGEFPKVMAFTRAQLAPKEGEAAPDNLLSAVKFPTFAADSPVRSDLTEIRKVEQAGPWRGRVPTLITLEIATQEWEPAMKRAQQLLMSDVTALDGPQQISRVFKAKDDSVVRSNQFLAYLEGKAANPFPAFFEQVAAGA